MDRRSSLAGRAALAVASVLSLAALCGAQEARPACDFSGRKPLVISHALLNQAVVKVEPVYPAVARAAQAEGDVEVKILVDRKGLVVAACAPGGHALLREAARKAALGWRFRPNFGLVPKGGKLRHRYIQSSIVFKFRVG